MKRATIKLFRRISPWLGLGSHGGPAILLYHRVADLPRDPQHLAVSPRNFEEQLDVLRRYAKPLPLAELVELAAAGSLPERAVGVTFDDGYADNLVHARPILQSCGVPATVFVCTGRLDTRREFWWDELERLLLEPGTLPHELTLTIAGRRHAWNLGEAAAYSEHDAARHGHWNVLEEADPTPRHAVYRELSALLRPLFPESRETALAALRQLAGAADEGRETHRALTLAQLRRLADGDLVEIGAHTATHSVLSRLPPAVQHAELAKSRRRLEQVLGLPVRSFSYPFGTAHDFTDETVRLVRAAGFKYACANVEGNVAPRSDRFRLPRFLVRNWDGETFARKLQEWTGVPAIAARRAG